MQINIGIFHTLIEIASLFPSREERGYSSSEEQLVKEHDISKKKNGEGKKDAKEEITLSRKERRKAMILSSVKKVCKAFTLGMTA